MAASREELEQLIRSADAAGDGDAVRVLFGELDKLDAAPPKPTDYSGFVPPQMPMVPLPNYQGAFDKLNEAAGVTAEPNPMSLPLAPLETLATGATAALALPISGLAGLLVKDRSGKKSQADIVRSVQEALTYRPRTSGGQAMTAAVSLPGQAYGAGTNFLGEKATDITGSPLIGATIKTTGDIAPSLIGARSLPKSQGPAPKGKFTPNKFDVPTTEQLRKASTEAYAAAKDSGVIVPADGYGKALGSVREMVTKEGIDPTLHPKTTAVMKRLEGANGKPLTLQEAETLRKIALDAEDDLNPVTRQPTPDSRLAGKVVDELDEHIEALSANDQARALWSRSRRSQMIDQMVHRAEIKAGAHYTQAGMEHALRQEFKQLAMNPRRMRGLTADQRAAIEKVAKGGPLENTLRTLGKFDPTTGGVAAAASIGTGAGLAGLTGGASMGLPLLGVIGRRAATKMTSRNVDKAREALVGRGTTGGLLGGVSATQPLVAPRGIFAGAAPRSAAQLRKEIASLDNEVQRLSSMGPASATVRVAVESELVRLQRELADIEAQGERP